MEGPEGPRHPRESRLSACSPQAAQDLGFDDYVGVLKEMMTEDGEVIQPRKASRRTAAGTSTEVVD